MKKIVVLTYGDANKPSTWSNVPYLLVNALKKQKDYKIESYNIETKQNIFTYFYSLIFLIFNHKSRYYFVRSKINYNIVMKKIKKIIKKEDHKTDLYIVIDYEFDLKKYTQKKVMLLSDWNVEYDVEKWLKRKPYLSEKKHIHRTKNAISNADYVVSLVEDFKKYAELKYNREILYFGMPINAFLELEKFCDIHNRNYITFIGKKSYISSAREIIKAYKNGKFKEYELHIIGLTKEDFDECENNNVYFHGYLDKGNKQQLNEYYEVIKHSKIIINTNEKWSGLSSISEALYYYRPIIIAKNEETLKKFGEKSSFVFYSKNESNHIADMINKIINLDEKKYYAICNDAHNFVGGFTYDKFVSKLIRLIKK